MNFEPLSAVVAALESGKRPKGGASDETGTIPSLGGEHLNNDGGFRLGKLKFIEEDFFNSLKKGTIRKNDILIVKDGATTGKVSYVSEDFPFKKAAINEHLFALTVDTFVADPRYVFSFLRSPQGQMEILKDFRGAAIGGISRGFVDLAQIPLPPLDDQIRIANLLGKVEHLIAQRKQHLQQLDELLKSVFLELFGDPVRNEMGWDKPELKAFGKISTGNTPPRNDPTNYDDDFIEWIKTDNITGDAVFVTPSAEHLSETGARRGRTVSNGALLVACIAGSVESIGRAALSDRTVAFNQQINAIQPAADVNPFYLYGLFKLSRAYIQSHATKGMKKILTKGDFEKITMIKPPLDIQNQFAVIIEKVESIKAYYQQSLTELEALYGALSQQAFKGELDLSFIRLADEYNERYTLSKANLEMQNDKKDTPQENSHLLTTEEGRIQILRQMFDTAIGKLRQGEEFDLDSFWIGALLEAAEYVDEDSEPFGIAEYEQLKVWIFDLLKSGQFKQSFEEMRGQVVLAVNE